LGISTLDADENTNRLHVTVTSADQIPAVQKLAADAGIPSSALTVGVRPYATLAGSLRNLVSPQAPGSQIEIPYGQDQYGQTLVEICSLGFNVTLNNQSGNATDYLTASHCSAPTGNGFAGINVYQPSYAGVVLGQTSLNPPWTVSDPQCMGHTICIRSDALLGHIAGGTAPKRVPFTDHTGFNNAGGSLIVTGYWDSVANVTAQPMNGTSIDKMGRTTGWTRGTLAAQCVTNVAQEATNPSITVAVICSNGVEDAGWGTGDSGSPVFIPPPSGQIHRTLRPLGLLSAGGGETILDNDEHPAAHVCVGGCIYYYSTTQSIATVLGSGIRYGM
jgi:hypothetical protein